MKNFTYFDYSNIIFQLINYPFKKNKIIYNTFKKIIQLIYYQYHYTILKYKKLVKINNSQASRKYFYLNVQSLI